MGRRSFAGYLCEESLAKSVYGEVFRGQNARGDEARVVVVEPSLSKRKNFAVALARGAGDVAELMHPHIVTTQKVGRGKDGSLVVIASAVDGAEDAASLLTRTGGRLRQDVALGVAMGALRGLSHAHEHRVLHGAIHPASVLVDAKGVSKLADFGLALALASAASKERELFGAVARSVAPEMLLGQEPDQTTDVYGGGALVARLLWGREVRDTDAGALAEVIRQATSKNRMQRFSNAAELESAVRRAITQDAYEVAGAGRIRDYIATLGEVGEGSLDADTEDFLATLELAPKSPARPPSGLDAALSGLSDEPPGLDAALSGLGDASPVGLDAALDGLGDGPPDLDAALGALGDEDPPTELEETRVAKPVPASRPSPPIRPTPVGQPAVSAPPRAEPKPPVVTSVDPLAGFAEEEELTAVDDDYSSVPAPADALEAMIRSAPHPAVAAANPKPARRATEVKGDDYDGRDDTPLPAPRPFHQDHTHAVDLVELVGRQAATSSPFHDDASLPVAPPRSNALRWIALIAFVLATLFAVAYTKTDLLRGAERDNEDRKLDALEEIERLQPKAGQITLQSETEEAAVWLLLGRTPTTSFPLPSSMVHELRIEHEGFAPLFLSVGASHWSGAESARKATLSATMVKQTDPPVVLPAFPPIANPPIAPGGPGKGVITVESVPEGAEVWLLVGTTPEMTLTGIEAGKDYEFKVLKDGHKPAFAAFKANAWYLSGSEGPMRPVLSESVVLEPAEAPKPKRKRGQR